MKNIKIYRLFFVAVFCQNLFGVGINKPEGLKYNSFLGDKFNIKSDDNLNVPRVLYVHIVAAKGGGAAQTVTLYDSLFNNGFNIDILVAQDSPISMELADKNLPCYLTNILKSSG